MNLQYTTSIYICTFFTGLVIPVSVVMITVAVPLVALNTCMYLQILLISAHLHIEFDHLHEFLHLGYLVDLPVGLVKVEPTFAYISQACPDGSSQCADPTVFEK